MRILIVSPELEDTNYRGVQFVTKHVTKALSMLGHEVILLTSHPPVKIHVKSNRLRERVLNTYFRQYLANGSLLNARMTARRKINYATNTFTYSSKGVIETITQTVGTFLLSFFGKLTVFSVDKTRISGNQMIKYVDKSVNFPFYYRLINAMPRVFRKQALDKIVKQLDVDLVFVSFPLVIPKLKSAKIVQMIHDLIPFEIAEEPIEFGWLTKLAYNIDFVARNADRVFTVSEDSKRSIEEVVPEARVSHIGAAISAYQEEVGRYAQDSGILNKFNLKNRSYLLFISSVEKRKNVHRLLQAFVAAAKSSDTVLVIAGSKSNVFDEIYKEIEGVPAEIFERIIFTGYITEFDKYTLLRNALALINPTLYEGFGLPVLEAFVSGCPVVASTAGALAEVSGDAI
ncbi:glycosyltransferase family 4 protein [bacterium]|nr:glycosyltransferase family 4 protein [bacterium]